MFYISNMDLSRSESLLNYSQKKLVMHSLGFPFVLFSTAIAQLLTESDQANLPKFVPPTIPDIDFNSYDSGNMNPGVFAPSVSINQFTPNIIPSLDAQGPSNDIQAESSMEPATFDAVAFDPEDSPSSCSSASTTNGRTLRREQGDICVPPVPLSTKIKQFIDWVIDPFKGDSSTEDTTQEKGPTGEFSKDDEERKKELYETDKAWRTDWIRQKREDPVQATSQVDICTKEHRPEALCCLGPKWTLTQKRAEPIGFDIRNCVNFYGDRPFCVDPGKECQFCCKELDYMAPTEWGWMGRDCVHMWAIWIPGPFNLRID